MPRQKLLLFLCIFVLPLTTAYQYSPEYVDNNYPLIYYVGSNSGYSHASEYVGSADYSTRTTIQKQQNSIGPPASYGPNNQLLFPVRQSSGSNSDYLFFRDQSGSLVTSVTAKPKQGTGMTIGYLDQDGKPDLIFRDAGSSGKIAVADTDGVSRTFGFKGNPIDIADLDKDGFQELLYYNTNDGRVEYNNFRANDSGGVVSSVDPGDASGVGFSTLSDFDGDSDLEYAYRDGNQNIELADMNGTETQISPTTSGKNKPIASFYAEGEHRIVAALGDSKMDECTLQGCTDISIGTSEKTKGVRSFIPPVMSGPTIDQSDGVVSRGSTVSVSFNVTDYEGYTDIVADTADVVLEHNSGVTYNKSSSKVNLTETSSDVIPGSNENGGFVPNNSKKRAFTAEFNISDNITLGNWTATAIVKDSHFVGVRNQTNFSVERGVAERNVSESMQLGQPAARSLSLQKQRLTLIGLQSPSLISGVTNRFFEFELGVSKLRERSQSLKPFLPTQFAVQSGGERTKAAFESLADSLGITSIATPLLRLNVNVPQLLTVDQTEDEVTELYGVISEYLELNSSEGQPARVRAVAQSFGISPVEQTQRLAFRVLSTALTTSESTQATPLYSRTIMEDVLADAGPTSNYDGFRGIDLAVSISPSFQIGQATTRFLREEFSIGEYAFSAANQVRSTIQNIITGNTPSRSSEVLRESNQSIYATENQYRGVGGRVVDYTLAVAEASLGRELSQARLQIQDVTATGSYIEALDAFETIQSSLYVSNNAEATSMLRRGILTGVSALLTTGNTLRLTAGVQDTVSAAQESAQFTRVGRYQNTTYRAILGSQAENQALARALTTSYLAVANQEVFDGVIISIQQSLGLANVQGEVTRLRRDQQEIIPFQSGTNQVFSLARSVSQAIGIELDLTDLIDYVLDFFRESTSETQSDPAGSDSSSGTPSASSSTPGNALPPTDEPTETPRNRQTEDLRDNTTSTEDESPYLIENKSFTATGSKKQVIQNISHNSTNLIGLSLVPDDQVKNGSLLIRDLPSEAERNDTILDAVRLTADVDVSNASLTWIIKKSTVKGNDATRRDIVVKRWKGVNGTALPRTVRDKNTSHYSIQAHSPEGFSVFTVELDDSAPADPTVSKPRSKTSHLTDMIPVIPSLQIIILSVAAYLLTPSPQAVIGSVKRLISQSRSIVFRVILKGYGYYLQLYVYIQNKRKKLLANDLQNLHQNIAAHEHEATKLQARIDQKKERLARGNERLEALKSKIKELWDKIR